MVYKLKQWLAITLTFVLCVAGTPVQAIAEATSDVEAALAADAAPLSVLYRTNAINNDQSAEADWDQFAPQQSDLASIESLLLADESPEDLAVSPTTADPASDEAADAANKILTSLEMRLSDDAVASGVTYRVKALDGTWQESWTASPAVAEDANGIAGVQARLSDELDATYDLWYRAQTSSGTQLDWTLAPNALEASTPEALHGFEAVLTNEGELPEASEPAATDANTQNELPADEQPDLTADPTQADEPQSTEDDAIPLASDEQALDVEATTEDALEVQSDEQDVEVAAKEVKEKTIEVQEDPQEQEQDATLAAESSHKTATPIVRYRASMKGSGWQSWVKNGATAGVVKKNQQIKALRLKLGKASGGITYRAHVQGIGWQKWVSNGALAGTTSNSRRVEAIRVKLTGSIAKTYNVWYRANVRGIGWQPWVKNGATAGTTGRGLPIRAIEVLLVKKDGTIPASTISGAKYQDTSAKTTRAVRYQSYVSGAGWKKEVANGTVSGAAKDATALEAVRINATGIDGSLKYSVHVSGTGWKGWKKNGAVAGTVGKGEQLQAIRIKLSGNAAQQYDVYYRAYAQGIGWLAWTKNGAIAGTVGHSLRMCALQVKLVKRGAKGPADATAAAFAHLGNLKANYRANVLNSGWQDTVSQGQTAGTTGVSGRIVGIKATLSDPSVGAIRYSVCAADGTWKSWKSNGATASASNEQLIALKFKLGGVAAKRFNIWYRVHVAHIGWLDWAKNGSVAGGDSPSNPIEAYEVVITNKRAAAPGPTGRAYAVSSKLHGVDISGWDAGIDVANTEGDFFIIKATEGVQGTIYNPAYAQWAYRAMDSGRLVGFYHYANGGDPLKEADSFYNAIKGFKGRAIACLDWEGQGNPSFESGKDVAWCKKFLDRLKLRYGGTPLIYMSKSVTNKYDWSSVARDYPLWGAQYPDYEPVYGYQSNPWQSNASWGAWGRIPLIFQYTSTGVLQKNGGIEAFDFDLFYGAASDWRKLLS